VVCEALPGLPSARLRRLLSILLFIPDPPKIPSKSLAHTGVSAAARNSLNQSTNATAATGNNEAKQTPRADALGPEDLEKGLENLRMPLLDVTVPAKQYFHPNENPDAGDLAALEYLTSKVRPLQTYRIGANY
jgi:hypothetical protein